MDLVDVDDTDMTNEDFDALWAKSIPAHMPTMWDGDEDVLLKLWADHDHETSQIMRANS